MIVRPPRILPTLASKLAPIHRLRWCFAPHWWERSCQMGHHPSPSPPPHKVAPHTPSVNRSDSAGHSVEPNSMHTAADGITTRFFERVSTRRRLLRRPPPPLPTPSSSLQLEPLPLGASGRLRVAEAQGNLLRTGMKLLVSLATLSGVLLELF